MATVVGTKPVRRMPSVTVESYSIVPVGPLQEEKISFIQRMTKNVLATEKSGFQIQTAINSDNKCVLQQKNGIRPVRFSPYASLLVGTVIQLVFGHVYVENNPVAESVQSDLSKVAQFGEILCK